MLILDFWLLTGRSNSQDQRKNGVLAVQTIRKNITASTFPAMTTINPSSLIGFFVSSMSDSSKSVGRLVYGNKTSLLWSVKYFSILVCFLVAFLCNVLSIRYYAHATGFLTTLPSALCKKESLDHAAKILNHGSYFWSLDVKAEDLEAAALWI